jgi:hypothetical protein
VILPRLCGVVYGERKFKPGTAFAQLRGKVGAMLPPPVDNRTPTIIPLRRVAEEGQRLRDAITPRLTLLRGGKSGPPLAARRFLKFMLPAVPITAFVLTFLYGYLLLGMHSQTTSGKFSGAVTVDPALPLIGALLLSFALGALCVSIYLGFLRITDREQ